MSPSFKTALSVSSLALALLAGCDSDSPTQAGGGGPVGTWKNQPGDTTLTLVVKADMSFSGVRPVDFGTYTMTGTYTVEGNKIILNYASGLLDQLGIPPPPTNPDTAILAGTALTLHIPYEYDEARPTMTLKKQ